MSDLSAVQNLLCKVSAWLKEKQEVVKSGKSAMNSRFRCTFIHLMKIGARISEYIALNSQLQN